jgi:uncharacterized damage-inducible protein DinB
MNSDPIADFRQALRTQYGATIEMLRRAIQACPDDLWDARKEGRPPFWHVAYHTIFFLDLYSGDSDEMHKAFRGQPFHTKNAQRLDKAPEPSYTRQQVEGYLETAARKALDAIEGLKPEDLQRRTAFQWLELTVAEMLLYNLRHVAHHVGQLNAVLRAGAGGAAEWIAKA